MSKIELDNITSGYNLGKINANFVKIEDALTNNVLFRDATGSTAGPNQMVQDIDMDSQSILNLPTPTAPTNPVRLQDLGDYATSTELTEVDNRLTAADLVLQNNINNANIFRSYGDLGLQNNIDTANSVRASADSALDGRVTTLEQGTSGTDLYIHWLYNNGLALGGEVQLNIPYEFTSIATVYINGVRMSYGLAFDYDVAAKTVQLAEALETGDEVVVSLGTEPQEVSALVQSITEEVILTDGQTIVTFVEQNTNGASYHINGPDVDSRFLSSEDFTASSTTSTTITLTESYPAGSIITLSKNVAGSGGIDGDIRREFVHNEPTLAVAVTSTLLRENDAINLRERTTGNGGGATWDVVLSTGVTENGYNIVQCTGVPTLSLVLRVGGVADVKQFGATGDGVTDDTLATQAALDYAAIFVRKVWIPAPSNVYYITASLNFQNIDAEGEVSIAFEASTNSLFKTDQNILMFNIFATRFNTLKNITGQFTQASPSSSAIGFQYGSNGSSGNNVRLGTFENLIVQNAFTGHITSSSLSTVAVATWKNCTSRFTQGGWGFDFSATGGSTNVTMINCFAESDPSKTTRKGMRFTNIKDLNLIGCSIDFALNDGLVITNMDTYNITGLSFESPTLNINNQSLVTITNAQGFISTIGLQALTVNPGAGNDCAIVAAPNAGGLNIGHQHQLGTTITSGTLYKYRIASIEVGGLNIDDHDCVFSDIEYNGFDSRVRLNGTVSVPSFNFINGTHQQGDEIFHRAPTEAGATSSKYTVKSWSKHTVGATNVLNTDWFENRTLTGN